jgi:Tol biopolymer transport system component
MPLSPGVRLGPYEILDALGAGGMGEVYRARDTRLDRTVAIKILPEQLSSDPIRKQRFEREAKTISSLNHPHICVLHDVGSQDGISYLVMECVEGETLAKRLEKGPLPLEQVLKYGMQIADALDKAHRSGVVHRDLKPGNIMLTSTGAKLLDFGLAKPTAAALTSVATLTAAVTQPSPMTEQGAIVGTFQYMSPEQVEGKELDGRSDIFSFGAVLYEMLTGQRPFQGKSQLSVANAILEKEPAPITAMKPTTPLALDHVIRKCLAKTPEDRWQSASDLASELKWIGESGSQAGLAARVAAAGKIPSALPWLVSFVLLLALVIGAIWWRSSKPTTETMYFLAPMQLPASDVALSPNGHTVAVVGYWESAREVIGTRNAIWIYEVGSQDWRSLGGTEGASYPFWSPDGKALAFFAEGKLKKLEVSGGPVQIICDAPSGRGGTWNRDGVIVFTPNATLGNGLYRVSASGGIPRQISKPDPARGEESHRYAMFLPDGSHYLYLAANFSGRKEEVDGIFVGSLDSNEKRFVTAATSNAAYAAPGYLLFCRGKTLFAQHFDLKRFALTGEPTTILTEIQQLPQVGRAVFAASNDGLLIAQTGSQVALSQPLWFDRKGNELGAVGKPGVYGNVSLAPNGKTVAVNKTDMESLNTDVWIYELQRDSPKRLTFSPGFNVMPIWNPDASRLTFASNRQLSVDLFIKKADGAQEEQDLVRDENDKFPYDWSRDGRYVLFAIGSSNLEFVTLPELKTGLFLKVPSAVRNAQFSPDEKWVAYASNETGKWEIYVTSFPEARGRWQVSTGGGEQPRWRRDGKELFYLSSDGKMMAAPVTIGTNFDAGKPIELFQTSPRQPMSYNDQVIYDVGPDGQRFLILTQTKQAEGVPMSVVLNWAAKLNK